MNTNCYAQYELNYQGLAESLPESPGVYLFKDVSGRVVYAGKAKNLKKRILSYLKAPGNLSSKTNRLMEVARGLDVILTSSEKEALILESNLIKKLMPRYNVILRDDKRYPCLRLDVNEPYPRLTIVRKIKNDDRLYFGPFSSANAVRSTLKFIDRVFQLRKCKDKGLPQRSRPCLNHQIGRCLAPCTGDISASQYAEVVQQVKLFLEGRNRELINNLKDDMQEASKRLEFERAASIRDQIRAIEYTIERQDIVSSKMEDYDVLGLANNKDLYQVVVLLIRKGALIGNRTYVLMDEGGSSSEVMEAFLKQYYSREPFMPRKVLISEPVEDLDPIRTWLSELSGKQIELHRPQRGEKLRLVKMAVANAEHLLKVPKINEKDDLMIKAQALLHLKRPPRYIEGMDISDLQGNVAVGSIVSFVDGEPQRGGYRNYKIKTVEGIDDYLMMEELVRRRIKRGDLPDLFLVDGGKGHLSIVKRVLEENGHQEIPEVVSIAKSHGMKGESPDKVYITGRKNPLTLRGDDPVLHLMMQIRDEAHRRVVSYHRKLSTKGLTESHLDHIAGIGKKKKMLLLRNFKDIYAIARAGKKELTKVPGIGETLAEEILRSIPEGDVEKPESH